MEGIFFCVLGIEYGMTSPSKVVLMGTFSEYDLAKQFIAKIKCKSAMTIIDIVETYIDGGLDNDDLENAIDL